MTSASLNEGRTLTLGEDKGWWVRLLLRTLLKTFARLRIQCII